MNRKVPKVPPSTRRGMLMFGLGLLAFVTFVAWTIFTQPQTEPNSFRRLAIGFILLGGGLAGMTLIAWWKSR
jgi:hypothetical protein